MASEMMVPTSRSPFAEIVPTCEISSLVLIFLAPFSISATTASTGAFAHDRLGQHGRRGGAVAGQIVGLGSNFLDHLRTHVLELVFQFDLLGDGDAVLGDARRAERLVEDDVAALRTQRHLNGVGKRIDTLQQLVAC
jgi:hypothetical protein